MEKDNNEMSPLGKVLLLLGGAVILGTILSIDDEPEKSTRETSQGNNRKEKGSFLLDKYEKESKVIKEKPLKTKDSKVKYLKIMTSQPSTVTKKKDLGGTLTSSSEDRKYPDHYYTLNPAQQYKFRKREKSKLTNYIASNDNANFE